MTEDKKYYVVMRDYNNMAIAMDSYTEAQKKVVNDIRYYPHGYISVIENGIGIKEIMPFEFELVYSLAARINNVDFWCDVMEECAELCKLLDMENEWNAADGESFIDVIRVAGEKIGVDLV